jgi:dephospho-CoA kinase
MIIGLTGPYCAGKNFIAALLEARGLETLDVDKLGHQAIEQCRQAILARFGPGILGDDGRIDRRALGTLAFAAPLELAALEAIVHPQANRLTDAWIAARGDRPVVINAALLHRSSAFDRLDCVIQVRAPFLTRLLRARRRDRLPWKALFKRFDSQKHFFTQYFGKNADIYTIDNGGISAGPVVRQLDAILHTIGLSKHE